MINILVPMAGKDTFSTSDSNYYPKLFSNIKGRLLIERASQPFINIPFEKKIVLVMPEKQIEKYKLDKIAQLLGCNTSICSINESTQGAACSALLAIEKIDLQAPLIITSFEQVLEFDLSEYIQDFIDSQVDAGVFTFESIHPQWSYVKTNDKNVVIEAAEKRPISNQAIAGLYFFKTGQLFVDSAMEMIKKDVRINNKFYISHCLNEVILHRGTVKAICIDRQKYFHISDEYSLELYESKIRDKITDQESSISKATSLYISSFSEKNITILNSLLANDVSLKDPNVDISTKKNLTAFFENIFKDFSIIKFIPRNIIIKELTSIIEFELIMDNRKYLGTDIIKWNDKILIQRLDAYLYEV